LHRQHPREPSLDAGLLRPQRPSRPSVHEGLSAACPGGRPSTYGGLGRHGCLSPWQCKPAEMRVQQASRTAVTAATAAIAYVEATGADSADRGLESERRRARQGHLSSQAATFWERSAIGCLERLFSPPETCNMLCSVQSDTARRAACGALSAAMSGHTIRPRRCGSSGQAVVMRALQPTTPAKLFAGRQCCTFLVQWLAGQH
jgi:hypothetical protein